MLTKFESLASSGAQKVTKEIEVGKLEGVKIIKQNGRFSSQVFFRKYKGALPKDDYKNFNLGNNAQHYVLPRLKSSAN